MSLRAYDRLFPNQDTMPKGGFGNLIALPLAGGPRKLGNTVFLNDQLEQAPPNGRPLCRKFEKLALPAAKWRVVPGVSDVLRIFRSHDVFYVMSQITMRRNGRPSLLALIRRGRENRAAEFARAQVLADEAEPALSPRLRKELKRRVSDSEDPTRHVIVSGLMGSRALVYDLENNCYGWGHVSRTALVKDRGVALAVARHLDRRRKRRSDLQVLRVRPGAKMIRALDKVRPAFGRRSFLPKFTTRVSIPVFVPITRAATRERFADVMLFALENQDQLLPIIRSAGSRSNAVAALMRQCSITQPEGNTIMDLRFGNTTRDSIKEFRAELRAAVRR